jgi:DNA-binding transcriptional ArsR family regulator
MSSEIPPDEDPAMSPDDAFNIVGDDTRIQILQTLGEADEPLTYSELLNRIEYDSTNFHYHLKKLDGHFIHETDDGYTLRQAGGRVVKAILSGAVTEYPVINRTPVETPCYLCKGDMEMGYRHEVVGLFCADCGGTRAETSETTGDGTRPATDIVGGLGLPPAGVHGRTPAEILRAAEVWTVTQGQAVARNVCPWCSASLDDSVEVCEDHDATDGRCQGCNQRFGVSLHVSCTNCIFEQKSIFTSRLLAHPDVMAFMLDHGIDPISPDAFHLTAEETIHSTDPFEGSFTFSADADAITLTVNDSLSVIEVTRHDASEIGC